MNSPDALPADVRALYPFASHWLDTPAGRVHYIDEGPRDADNAVICVHGNPTWSFFYSNVIIALSKTRRVIAIDHLGCGMSDKPQDYTYLLANHVENLARLVSTLQQSTLHCIVHDWGGPIGLAVAQRYANRVGKLVVMNTAAFFGPCPLRIRLCRIPLLGPVLVRGLNGFAGPAACMAVERPLPAAVKHGFLFPYNSWANRVAVLRFVEDIPLEPNHPSRQTMTAIESSLEKLHGKPMLIAWGMRDFCFSPVYLAEWRHRFPEATVREFPNAGHYLLEDAGDAIIPGLVDFLGR